MSAQALEYVEIDIPYCSLTYGVAPCTASLVSSPPTGTAKCFNTLATCQDTANYDPEDITLRFARDAEYRPRDIDALPYLVQSDYSPATVSLGADLGQRSQIRVILKDHPHSDAGEGFDKYQDERGYDPYTRGTLFGRFRTRQPYLRGARLRWINGFVGQDLADMETRYFFIESVEGPNVDGRFTIVAKDILKFLDGDRAQAPALSPGFLVGGINNSVGSATLSPAGIGNTDYPASGYVCIGGNEVCSFTRSGDVLTITRGQLGTTAAAHSANDRVQLVLRYSAEDPADIIADLMETYAGVPGAYIPLSEWQDETGTYLNRVYTATICEPTSVGTLISELIEQAALAIWDDNINQKIRLEVVRGVPTDAAVYSEANVLADTITASEQPTKRISDVWIYYGQINPTKSITDTDNFRSAVIRRDDESSENYGVSLKKIFSRWIPALGVTTAERVADLHLARFMQPPRRIGFQLLRSEEIPDLGSGRVLNWWNFQEADGTRTDIPVQIIRVGGTPGTHPIEAEEMFFAAPDDTLDDRQIRFTFSTHDINLKDVHDSLFPEIENGQSVTFTISAGVIIGATDATIPAVTVGVWPVGVTVNVVVDGRIEGAGGRGGNGGVQGVNGGDGQAGQDGGVALFVESDINLDFTDGEIWGGGGGGGGGGANFGINPANNFPYSNIGGGGGGGGGEEPGIGGTSTGSGADGTPGTIGTNDDGGIGGDGAGSSGLRAGDGGNGGAPGEAGLDGEDRGPGDGDAGGAAGAAIDGDSLVTITGSGDLRGPQIN